MQADPAAPQARRFQGHRAGLPTSACKAFAAAPLAAMVEIKRSVARSYNVSRSKILRL